MKRTVITVKHVLALALLVGGLSACQKENLPSATTTSQLGSKNITSSSSDSKLIDNQYIVILNDVFANSALDGILSYEARNTIVANQVKSLLVSLGLEDSPVTQVYSEVFKGFTIKLSNPAQLKVLELANVVVSIEQDQLMGLLGTPDAKQNNLNYAKAQTVSYGTVRTGSANGAGIGKRAFIIDTGIDLDHPDLNVNTELSKSFLASAGGGLLGGGLFGGGLFGGGSSTPPSPDDQNGHGTHCAGIIAAKDNTIGSKGVAYGAEVVAIQVLGSTGSGATSDIIKGIDYVSATAARGDVANMSLGGGTNTSLDNAVVAASNKGIWFTLAAGNDSQNANNSSPARANGQFILTISSIDSQNRLSSFSNFGNPPVDFAEPGSSIYSTYKNGGYSTLSGTSMAAPHAAGIILLRGLPANGGLITGDKDNTPDVIGVN